MIVTLLTGCNIGSKEQNMVDVIFEIEHHIGKVMKKSNLYISKAWGFESDDSFLNQAIVCDSKLSPKDIMYAIWDIERMFGKERGSREQELIKYKEREQGEISYQSRLMDIDIIFYGDELYKDELITIPHQMYKLRQFVLEPLCEIMGSYIPNGEIRSIRELLVDIKSKNN